MKLLLVATLLVTIVFGATQAQQNENRPQKRSVHPFISEIYGNRPAAEAPAKPSIPLLVPAPEGPKPQRFTSWILPARVEAAPSLFGVPVVRTITADEQRELAALKDTDSVRYARRLEELQPPRYTRLLNGDLTVFIEQVPLYPPKAVDRFLLTKGKIFEKSESRIRIRQDHLHTITGPVKAGLTFSWVTKVTLRPMKVFGVQL